MAIVETEDRYPGAFDIIECPVCGSEEWTHLLYQGVFCARCNTQCTLREPAGDQGFIAEFDSKYTWSVDHGEAIPETDEYGARASGKWLGTEADGYERYWFSAYADHVDEHDCEWEPAWDRETKNEDD
ncbi:hypothetical protein CV102_18395 [Natronococcus pandeyae]|uniref:Small CPxCG-related zinc finger protein n=1 Tax=Natronococcus pandeyae TaxID=2055836 RepID=A0A8J8Q3Y3_9EURY|nr:hypothetical protein [Natronococcus pandeyae]TYL37274.1 hypothetical protein CV102_18395 [Natronococcus pandeyae]